MNKANKVRAIDWRGIDDINKDLDHLEAMKADPDAPFGKDGPMKVDPGQVLKLTVRVTDAELAQIVLARSFVSDEGSRIPGMAIDAISIFPEQETANVISNFLEAISQRLNVSPELLKKLADPNWNP